MKLLKTILLLCLFSTAANAQFVTNSKRVADVYFDNKEYYAAAEYYKKALHISSDSAGFVVPYGFENKIKQESTKKSDYSYNVFRLAESLRLYKNFSDAEHWYAIAKEFPEPDYKLATFWYAETLRANQKFTESVIAYKQFLAKYPTKDFFSQKAQSGIDAANFAIYELRYPRLFQITRLQNQINGKGSNYAGMLNSRTFYFTSSRPMGTSGKEEVLTGNDNAKVIKKETPFLNAIYKVNGNPFAENITVEKLTDSRSKREYAAMAIHPNGRFAYVTSWKGKDVKKISMIKLEDNVWSEPVELGTQVNAKDANSIQPFVTADGKTLIFSSDRSGGSGKFDLWYSPLNADGTAGLAVNFGNIINTPEDEQAPYLNSSTKRLLFSSNGRTGMGGFDFYESSGTFGNWSSPRNMGYPFNSSKDDLYFTPSNSAGTEGYISSDRESVCCLEIFQVKQRFLTISGILMDCDAKTPLAGATVTLADSISSNRVLTDVNGKYSFTSPNNRNLKLSAEKENYFTKVLKYGNDELSRVDTLLSPELCLVPYEKDKPIVLKDVLYEFDKATLTEDSKLKLNELYQILSDNPSIEIELSSHTDSKGSDIYNLDLSQRRAASCVEYLIAKGISSGRMKSKGYGESMPVAPNTFPDGRDNPEGRALNRRTEFKVINSL